MQPLASEALPWDPPQSEEQPTASARTRSEEVDTVFGTQPAASARTRSEEVDTVFGTQPTASARTRSEEVDTVFGTQPAAFPDDSDVPKPDRRGKRLAGLQAAKEGRNAAQGSQ